MDEKKLDIRKNNFRLQIGLVFYFSLFIILVEVALASSGNFNIEATINETLAILPTGGGGGEGNLSVQLSFIPEKWYWSDSISFFANTLLDDKLVNYDVFLNITFQNREDSGLIYKDMTNSFIINQSKLGVGVNKFEIRIPKSVLLGSYTLKIRSRDSQISIPFKVVKKKEWQTYIFYGLIPVGIVSVIIIVRKKDYLLEKLEKKNAR